MEFPIINKYFNLNCANNIEDDVILIENEFSLKITNEYYYLIKSFCFLPSFNLIPFYIEHEFIKPKKYFFYIGTFHSLKESITYSQILLENENEIKKYDKIFKSYNLTNCIEIAHLSSINHADFEELYLDCSSSIDRGSLFLFDRNFNYDFNENGIPYKETGVPMKIKIANSISHLLEIAESQKDQIPKEYLIT